MNACHDYYCKHALLFQLGVIVLLFQLGVIMGCT